MAGKRKGKKNENLKNVKEKAEMISCPSATLCLITASSEWIARFDDAAATENNTLVNASLSGDSWRHYFLGQYVDGFNEMFKCTGDTAYLDKSLELICNVIDTAVVSNTLPNSTYSDTYLGWPNLSHPTSTNGQEYPLFESYFWRYGVDVLRCMKDTGLDTDPAYSAKFNQILAFVETHIFEKWTTRGDRHIYRNRTHMASHWAYIAMILAKCSSDPAIVSAANTIRDNINFAGYPAVTTGGGNYEGANLADQFYPDPNDPNAVLWSQTWTSGVNSNFLIQDITHGNAEVTYMVTAVECGVYWTKEDLIPIVETTKNFLAVDPTPFNIDGTGTANAGNAGYISVGFDKLGRCDCELQKQLEVHDGVGFNSSAYYATMATNAKILGS